MVNENRDQLRSVLRLEIKRVVEACVRRGRLRTRTRLVLARADNLQNRLSMLYLLSLVVGGGARMSGRMNGRCANTTACVECVLRRQLRWSGTALPIIRMEGAHHSQLAWARSALRSPHCCATSSLPLPPPPLPAHCPLTMVPFNCKSHCFTVATSHR